ncbi:MAG: hypothetical protein HY287_05515 [Planctomycetes bacterium]|nr:hypothetical protein [Planctomycetota bacterium]MBI3833769.1 hypothetical protein [Planctomycetota bacterium]
MSAANSFDDHNGMMDPFSKFWIDMMSKMSSGTASAQQPARAESVEKMRRAFFDAWAHHCDEFMRSDQFLESMKKTMDGALAFKQQVNEFLTRTLHETQMPARSDTDSIMLVLRSLEERLFEKIDGLSNRVGNLEKHMGAGGAPGGERTDPESSAAGARRAKGPK